MKQISLTQGKVTLVDDEDFDFLNRFKWNYQSKGYAHRLVNEIGKTHKTRKVIHVYMHRFLMNPRKGMVVDHMDGNTLNNQKSNLRICHHKNNIRNRTKLNKNNTSGFRGVSLKYEGKWAASIKLNYKVTHLGYFPSKELAYERYAREAKKHYGKYSAV